MTRQILRRRPEREFRRFHPKPFHDLRDFAFAGEELAIHERMVERPAHRLLDGLLHLRHELAAELAVAELVQSSMTDEEIDRIADEADAMMPAELEKTSEEEMIKAQLADCRKRKANVLKTLEMVASSSMANRLVELEEQERRLEARLVMEQARSHVFDRDEFVAFLRVIRTGDVRDPEFRLTLFDVYVSRVYIYDGTFTVDLNSGARADGYALPDPPEEPPVDDGDGVRPLETDVHHTGIVRTPYRSRSFGIGSC